MALKQSTTWLDMQCMNALHSRTTHNSKVIIWQRAVAPIFQKLEPQTEQNNRRRHFSGRLMHAILDLQGMQNNTVIKRPI
jgi:hypothetical protein